MANKVYADTKKISQAFKGYIISVTKTDDM